MAIVLASILDADWLRLSEEICAVDSAGIDGFSIDIMDGQFVPRETFGPHIVSIVRNITNAPIEVHLMVNNPEKQVEKYCDSGADQVIFHVEATKDALSLIKYIHSRGLQAGLAILQETDLARITDNMIESIDALLFMAVRVGFGGQEPSPQTLDRIAEMRNRAKDINPYLVMEVDGGMKPDNCSKYVKAGADAITIGTGIYKAASYEAAISLAKQNINSEDPASRKRLEKFLAGPSINLANDMERRIRLEKIRKDLDIPSSQWDPMNSKR